MDETTLDLRDILKTLKKRRKLIGYIFVGFVVLAALLSFLWPPTYESETNLRVKQPQGLADSLLSSLPTGNASATKQLMSTYAEILKSRTVVQEVIDKTQADKEEIPDYENMLDRITTQPVKDTEILRVRVTAKTPEEAQLVADTLVNTFNARLSFLTRSEQTVVRQFIGERLQESKADVEKAEEELQKYKTEQKITDPDVETKALVDALTEINKLAAENAVTMAAAQGKLASTRQQLGAEKEGFIADNPLIQQYKTKLAELEVSLVELTEKYTEQHPQVKATRAAIGETQAKLAAEVGRVITADAPSMNPIHQGLLQSQLMAEAQIAASTAQQVAIVAIVEQGQADLGKLPVKEQGLAKVMRDAEVAREIYVMLAKRHEEARISEVMQPTDIQVIDVATLPDEPIKPKKALNIVIAAILGLFAGLGAAFIVEYLNKSIHTVEDVRQYLDLPVLGSIPHFDNEYKESEPSFWDKLKQLLSTNSQRGQKRDV
ncbi:GumC family protein|uniref:Polysaccharide chain length determinant protein, PEP-CTERM locus subfamily n=1 Tax=Dendrosporobacter quercicolus TaxID=146817 RepID=A0A1G9WNS2_9FIRM|nr:GumC family protein [Dendrosporobacter quercicolus]NSL49167.1 GumC family protein [Dendrosporobacter quercicolus DSM 1736]SDM86212.1 polysaccharide chain length determinant protein, PEP-CTERM locus subfamily [Dendrosporobacter quercicolus]